MSRRYTSAKNSPVTSSLRTVLAHARQLVVFELGGLELLVDLRDLVLQRRTALIDPLQRIEVRIQDLHDLIDLRERSVLVCIHIYSIGS